MHVCACVSLCVHVCVSVFVCVCACMSGNLSTCHKGITSQTPIEISHLLWQAVSLVLGPGNQSSSYAHTHSHTHKHTHTHTHTHTHSHTHNAVSRDQAGVHHLEHLPSSSASGAEKK